MENSMPKKIILIAIDSLDPEYLYLNSNGQKGGCQGDWLMPNVRAFLTQGTWFENTRCYLPAATDMNHVNAIAGTHIGQTGITSVGKQFFDWNEDGSPNIVSINYSFLKDGNGNKVDTLFNLWKRKWKNCKTAYITGKQWVGNIFKAKYSDVDIIVGGETYPDYVTPPSKLQNPKETSFRQNILMDLLGIKPENFPSDAWVVQAATQVLKNEEPDISVILLGQMDDMQHTLGCGKNPDEFFIKPYPLRGDIEVSKYNIAVRRQPILEEVKEIDEQFGLLIKNIKSINNYKNAVIVLYSDHGHITHRDVDYLMDWYLKSKYDMPDHIANTDVVKVLSEAGFFYGELKDGNGFCSITATSMGLVHIKGATLEDRLYTADIAKGILLKHRVWDHFSDSWVCPWHVLNMQDTYTGIPGIAGEGELFHRYFAFNNERGKLHWPDLFIFMKDHWEFPVAAGAITSLGISLPDRYAKKAASANLMFGGHGSNDTNKVVMCFHGPHIASGRIIQDENYSHNYRIADIAVTIADIINDRLLGTKSGKSRLKEINKL